MWRVPVAVVRLAWEAMTGIDAARTLPFAAGPRPFLRVAAGTHTVRPTLRAREVCGTQLKGPRRRRDRMPAICTSDESK
jgi:hypothetical protein